MAHIGARTTLGKNLSLVDAVADKANCFLVHGNEVRVTNINDIGFRYELARLVSGLPFTTTWNSRALYFSCYLLIT